MKNKLLALIVIVIFSTAFKPAENVNTATPEFISMYLETWDIMTANILDVYDAMPEDKFDYKPTEVSRTFADQMSHLAAASKFLTQRFIEGKQVPFEKFSVEGKSKAEIKSFVEESLQYSRKVFETLTEEDLNKKVPFGQENLNNIREDGMVSKLLILMFINNHATNHRAKANLYLRMNDIDPPLYNF